MGIGVVTRTARASAVGAVLLAWVTTLPLAAGLAAAAYPVLAWWCGTGKGPP